MAQLVGQTDLQEYANRLSADMAQRKERLASLRAQREGGAEARGVAQLVVFPQLVQNLLLLHVAGAKLLLQAARFPFRLQQRVNERYMYLTGQRDDVEQAKGELEGIIAAITREMTVIFEKKAPVPFN